MLNNPNFKKDFQFKPTFNGNFSDINSSVWFAKTYLELKKDLFPIILYSDSSYAGRKQHHSIYLIPASLPLEKRVSTEARYLYGIIPPSVPFFAVEEIFVSELREIECGADFDLLNGEKIHVAVPWIFSLNDHPEPQELAGIYNNHCRTCEEKKPWKIRKKEIIFGNERANE